MARALLLALLALFHRTPHRACLAAHVDEIVRRAERAQAAHGVPPGVLLAVGFLESHLGCAPGSGGNWGAPVSPAHRHTAGTSDHAARSLATGYRVCGTWAGSVGWFRCGRCACPRLVGYEPGFAMRVVGRVYREARVPEPDHMR